MPTVLDAPEILNREFLEVRARLLQVAATLDRLNRAAGSVVTDPRIGKIHETLEVLSSDAADRAEQIQLIFSRPYDDEWQDKYGVPPH